MLALAFALQGGAAAEPLLPLQACRAQLPRAAVPPLFVLRHMCARLPGWARKANLPSVLYAHEWRHHRFPQSNLRDPCFSISAHVGTIVYVSFCWQSILLSAVVSVSTHMLLCQYPPTIVFMPTKCTLFGPANNSTNIIFIVLLH